MLEISRIKENKEEIINRLKLRNVDMTIQINMILELDEIKKKYQQHLEKYLFIINKTSKSIGEHLKKKEIELSQELKKIVALIKNEVTELKNIIIDLEKKIYNLLIKIPNIPHIFVSSDNVIIEQWGNISDLPLFKHYIKKI